jgi:hypothetical protein
MNLPLELALIRPSEGSGIGIARKQGWRHQVDALVRRLGGQNRRDQQLERVRVMQLGISIRMLGFERVQDATGLARRLHFNGLWSLVFRLWSFVFGLSSLVIGRWSSVIIATTG